MHLLDPDRLCAPLPCRVASGLCRGVPAAHAMSTETRAERYALCDPGCAVHAMSTKTRAEVCAGVVLTSALGRSSEPGLTLTQVPPMVALTLP